MSLYDLGENETLEPKSNITGEPFCINKLRVLHGYNLELKLEYDPKKQEYTVKAIKPKGI